MWREEPSCGIIWHEQNGTQQNIAGLAAHNLYLQKTRNKLEALAGKVKPALQTKLT